MFWTTFVSKFMDIIPYTSQERAKPGRPKGTTKGSKFNIKDHFKRKELREFIKMAKDQARRGDKAMLKFLLEQVFGKPVQSNALTNKDGEDIVINQVIYNANKDTISLRATNISSTIANSPTEQQG
jgi:hypothetical protein